MTIPDRKSRLRRSGWRKPGGLYLVAYGPSTYCGILPIELSRCPCCGQGISPTRGWSWIDAARLVKRYAGGVSRPPTAEVAQGEGKASA